MKVSIVTVNLNNGCGLESTLKSSIAQKRFKDFEIIVIDGGSTDGSIEVIETYASHIAYWISEPDRGIYNGMNKGIKEACGEYIIFMNSGDCFNDEFVLWNIFGRLSPKSDIVCGDFIDGNSLHKMPKKLTAMYMFNNALCHQAVFLHSSMLKAQPYNEDYKITADWVQMYDALVLNDATYEHVDVVVCVLQANGISKKKWQRLAAERIQYKKEVLPSLIYEDYQIFSQENRIGESGRAFIQLLSQIDPTSRPARWVEAFMRLIIKVRQLKQYIINR